MESYEETYKAICRICLNFGNSKSMVSLIDDKVRNGISYYGISYYGIAVQHFANISIDKHDNLPSVMCVKCLSLLKQAIRFKLMCESSDESLKEMVKVIGDDVEKMRESVIEYAMFKFYFPQELKTTHKHVKTNREKQNLINSVNESNVMSEKVNDEVDSGDCFHIQSDKEKISQKEDDLLNKIENLIEKTPFNSSMQVTKMFKRKHLQLKRKLLMRQKMLKMKKANEERKKKKFVCNICNKVLANQNTYEHHLQRHNGCRYICEHCGKGFPVKNELFMHQVTRHGTGPYLQCSHCPFKAPRRFDLIEHERLHTGERPYTCDKCGLTFRRRGIWKKHLIYHMEKKVQCPQCPRKFYQRSEMLAHANNVHERVYVYVCDKCGATYAKSTTVRRHLTERHGIPREMQGKIIRVNKSGGSKEQ